MASFRCHRTRKNARTPDLTDCLREAQGACAVPLQNLLSVEMDAGYVSIPTRIHRSRLASSILLRTLLSRMEGGAGSPSSRRAVDIRSIPCSGRIAADDRQLRFDSHARSSSLCVHRPVGGLMGDTTRPAVDVTAAMLSIAGCVICVSCAVEEGRRNTIVHHAQPFAWSETHWWQYGYSACRWGLLPSPEGG